MYADVAAATGWTWEYIGQCLTWPRLEAMHAHWRRYPPVHISVALFTGSGTRASASKPKAANDQADAETAAYAQSMPIMKMQMPGK
jgi:hypothetical protein